MDYGHLFYLFGCLVNLIILCIFDRDGFETWGELFSTTVVILSSFLFWIILIPFSLFIISTLDFWKKPVFKDKETKK